MERDGMMLEEARAEVSRMTVFTYARREAGHDRSAPSWSTSALAPAARWASPSDGESAWSREPERTTPRPSA